MFTQRKLLLCIAISLLVGVVLGQWWGSSGSEGMSADSAERKPLYWVAPMDPNYRRDKPGKSPMGMDLIPVYEEDENAGGDAPGTVRVSPDVVNNLGVRTAEVQRGQLSHEVKTVGYVQYDEDRLVHIHPRVEGWIEKLYVKAAGDAVKQGEPLYALYSPTLVNAQEELLLALRRNNPVLERAALERLTALQVPESAIARLRKGGSVSQTITVYAPQTGVIDNLAAREGMFVQPGMKMMSIGVLEHIWVIGEIFERQLPVVRAGDKVQMRLDYLPGREWSGTVDYIYPSLNSQTRTGRVRVHFENPDGFLKPGMFAQMTIATRAANESLLIPREAVIRTGKQTRVVLAKDAGRFRSVVVNIGAVGDQQVEVLSGLDAGDRIVTSAQFLIDSESSKTADFTRMDHGKIDDSKEDQVHVESASAMGTVNAIDVDSRMINISRGPIEKWNRPAATLDFIAADTIDLKTLAAGASIHFVFEIREGDFVVTQIHVLDTVLPAHADDSKSTSTNEHADHGAAL